MRSAVSAGCRASRLHQHNWAQGLPFKMRRFRKSRLDISAILPAGIGFLIGIMSAVMGVGGAFRMVPAMIYLLGMPTAIVVGTSLFQIIFVQAYVTFLQSVNNQTVDVLLALILTAGGVVDENPRKRNPALTAAPRCFSAEGRSVGRSRKNRRR